MSGPVVKGTTSLFVSFFIVLSFGVFYQTCAPTRCFAGFVDDVIMPRETRKRLCQDLELLQTKNLSNIPRKHGNIPL